MVAPKIINRDLLFRYKRNSTLADCLPEDETFSQHVLIASLVSASKKNVSLLRFSLF